MLGLLPWEKLPLWLNGIVLFLLGVVNVFNSQPWSVDQGVGLILVFLCLGMLVHGVIKPAVGHAADHPAPSRADYVPVSLSDTPDFSTYSPTQLREILQHIDDERFPERVRAIHARLSGQAIP